MREASAIWLYIVTNDPTRALMAALACGMGEQPDWCAVISDPDLIDRLPDGIRAVGLFYHGRYRSKAERAWRDRRAFGGISGVSDPDLAHIEGWIEKRAAAERRLAFGDHMVASRDPSPDRIDRPEVETVSVPASVIAQVPADFRAMALSQRWV
jgi:hypothetical protein